MIIIRTQGVKNMSAGLTLIELLVSMVIFAIVLCCSFSFSPSVYKKNQLQMVTDEVKGAIHFAKIQSLLTGDILALTRIPGSNDWSEGMLLFVDNGKHQYGPDVKLLHEWHWQLSGVHIIWQGFQSKEYLLFSPDIGSNAVNGYFIIKNHMQQQAKLIVNRLGRIKEVYVD